MKFGKWHQGTEQPKKTGWYLRDYRNPPKMTTGELPPFSIDKFICDERSGYWFVLDEHNGIACFNDAWYTNLPWCKIKEDK